MIDMTNLRTVKQIASDPSNPIRKGTLRRWLNHRRSNGLARAVVKIGKVLYVDVPRFHEWLEKYREAKEKD